MVILIITVWSCLLGLLQLAGLLLFQRSLSDGQFVLLVQPLHPMLSLDVDLPGEWVPHSLDLLDRVHVPKRHQHEAPVLLLRVNQQLLVGDVHHHQRSSLVWYKFGWGNKYQRPNVFVAFLWPHLIHVPGEMPVRISQTVERLSTQQIRCWLSAPTLDVVVGYLIELGQLGLDELALPHSVVVHSLLLPHLVDSVVGPFERKTADILKPLTIQLFGVEILHKQTIVGQIVHELDQRVFLENLFDDH